MAFTMDGIVIDRIQLAIAEDFQGNPLYTLTQLSDAKIDISAESKEAKDANGTLIKKFYTGKSGTFTANSALVDFNILGETTGTGKIVAGEKGVESITMPRIIYVDKGTTTVELMTGADINTVKVHAIANNGTMGKAFTKNTSASATQFAVSGTTLTMPTGETGTERYVIKYNRKLTSDAVAIKNKADEFPRTIRLTLKALAVDPCEADTLRACYIVLPSFQVSPETSISLTTDSQLEYKGDLQSSYCSSDKTLYEIYMAADDAE